MIQWMKKNFDKQKKNEEGAVVVEATISLSVFMFFIVTILSIVNISSAQAKIGLALNATAKELSQYSYLYSLTGLDGIQSGNYDQTENVRTSTDNVLAGISKLMNSLGGDGSSGYESIGNEINNIASDPKSYILGAARLGLNEVTEVAKSRAIAAPLTKAFIQKHLISYKGQKCDEYLKHLGVKGGLDGIDFSDSVIFLNGSDNIILVADYEVEVIKLLNHEIKLNFVQSASTKAWNATPLGSDIPKPPSGVEDSTESEEDESEEETEPEPEQKRPTWQESEKYVGEILYPGYDPQKPFINGGETENGNKDDGSSIPDWYKDGHSVDVANYTILNEDGTVNTKNIKNLVNSMKKEYYDRLKNLPKGTQQTIVIDLRGQNISDELKNEIMKKIMDSTNDTSGYEEYDPKKLELIFIE